MEKSQMMLDNLEIYPVIYGIRCKVNNKIYIGKADNYLLRLGFHIKDLKNNKHHSNELQKDYNLYGGCNFDFIILEKFTDNENLILEEIKWISKFNSDELYNALNLENKIVSYNLKTGEILNKYFNISEASQLTKIPFINILLACDEKFPPRSAKGLGFCYEKDIDKIKDRIFDNRKLGNCKKAIKMFSKSGEFIKTFTSVTEASIELNISIPSISQCLKGKIKTSGGYIFKYA